MEEMKGPGRGGEALSVCSCASTRLSESRRKVGDYALTGRALRSVGENKEKRGREEVGCRGVRLGRARPLIAAAHARKIRGEGSGRDPIRF